jgi:hypothetical protein
MKEVDYDKAKRDTNEDYNDDEDAISDHNNNMDNSANGVKENNQGS